jgi:hypothetical protein
MALGSCAAFNRGELVLARNVTFGQELIDLKRAKDEGAISDEEYAKIKGKIMDMVDEVEVVKVVNEKVPDQISQPEDD